MISLVKPDETEIVKKAAKTLLDEEGSHSDAFELITPSQKMIDDLSAFVNEGEKGPEVTILDLPYTFFLLPYYTWYSNKLYPSIMKSMWEEITADYIIWCPYGNRSTPLSKNFIVNARGDVINREDGGVENLISAREDLILGAVVNQIGGIHDVCIVEGGPWESFEIWLEGELQSRV